MKRILPVLAILLLIPVSVQAASQISPRDGLWLSLPPDSVKCIAVRLPQDAGLPVTQSYIFNVEVTPGPRETWSDLSEQLVREVSENNTVLIPVCFDTAGSKPLGNCSAPYTITVSESYTGSVRSWRGGTCVSGRADADIVRSSDPSTGDDVLDILNDNADIFAAWLDEAEVYAFPGEAAVVNLTVQSGSVQGPFTVITQSSAQVTPASARLSTSPESPIQSQAFELQAPQDLGEHAFSARVTPEGCSGQSWCTKILEATLIVSEDGPPEKTGFEVVLRPDNIDARDRDPIPMSFTVKNHDSEEKTFTITLVSDPGDVSLGYPGDPVEVRPYSTKTKSFFATPGSSSSLYEITVRAEHGGITQSATSFISVDELRTDAERQAQETGSQDQVSQWLDSRTGGSSDLESYGTLKGALSQASDGQGNDTQDGIDDYNYTGYQREDPLNLSWLAIPFFLAAGAILALYFVFRKRSPKEEGEYY